MRLEDGSRVAVLGGGPAGSLFSYFLLTFAERMDLSLSVDIFEPRDFARPGPQGCNMCGGIVSESLVQALALEGIDLPPSVVQRGIDSYVLHTDEASIRLDTPLREKRIAAVHRGGGPGYASDGRWGGLDGHLLGLARGLGARVVPARVGEVAWDDNHPQVKLKGFAQTYDLLVGACGVNSSAWHLFETLGLRSSRPKTTRAYITEIRLGGDAVSQVFGSSMHTFLLDLPRLDMAAIIPKGDYVTVCLLGDEVDGALVDAFFRSPAVRRCFPETWQPGARACHCSPRINVREASRPFMDRVVLVGDLGATRLYKDGIGAAYRTAKAAARAAVFAGVSAANFERHYLPVCRAIAADNRCGLGMFAVVHLMKRLGPVLDGVVRMAAREGAGSGSAGRMSLVLWDMFTGSAPYREVFGRTLDPRFVGRLAWESVLALGDGARGKEVTCGSRRAG